MDRGTGAERVGVAVPLTVAASPGDDLAVSTSTILFLTGAACGVFFAALAVYGQARGGGSLRDVCWGVPIGIVVFGLLFGGMAFLLDSGVAGKTLFEAEVPGSGAAVPSVLEWEIPVEHPGAGHSLGVYPNSDRNVDRPADVRVQLVDELGRVLVDDERTLEPRCEDDWNCNWDGYSRDFTPPTGGELRLTVTVLTPDVPTVHVWLGDDEKTDGQRIPGY
jgi:hypothetical protein